MPANNDYTGFISSVQTPSGDLYKIRDMEVPAYFSGQNVCIEGLDPRYQRYESVYNSAQSVRIDTGVTTYNDDCEFYIRFKQTQSGIYMRLFGADTGGSDRYRIGFISLNTTSIKLCYRNATAITSTITRSKDHIYTLIGKLKNGSASLYVKDETTGETDYQTDTYNLDTSYNPEIRLFYISQGTAYMAYGTHVYRAMLKVKGECKLDYVPVKSPENVVGMYDTVTQTFRSNSNSSGGRWLVGTVANDNAFIVSAQGAEVMTGATSSTNGEIGLVPKPLVADRTKFLCGDGTWANIPTTTLTAESGIDINEYDEITSGFVRLNGRSGSYALHQCSLVACTDSMLGMTWLMEPLCTTGGTSSKVPNSNAKFPIGCQIYYHPDNTAFTANTDFATKMFYSSYESVPAAYTAVTGNSINLSNSSASSVFLRVLVNGANTHWSPYYKAGAATEIIVTSNNLVSSNFYIYLGKTNGNSQGFQLEDNHPLYYYDGSKLIDWASYIAELEASTISSQYLTIYSNGFNLALDTTISSGQQVAMTLSGSQSSLSGQFKLSSHLTLFGNGNADSRVEVRLMANPNYTNENERYYPIAATTHDVLSGHYCSIDLTDIYCRTTDGKLSVAVIVKNCGTTPVQLIGNKTDTTSQNTYPMSYLRLQRLNKYTGTIIVDNSYAATFSSNDDTLISQNT